MGGNHILGRRDVLDDTHLATNTPGIASRFVDDEYIDCRAYAHTHADNFRLDTGRAARVPGVLIHAHE